MCVCVYVCTLWVEGYEILYVCTLRMIVGDEGGRGNLLKLNKTIEERKKNHYGIESHVVSHRGTRSTLAIARIRTHTHTHTRTVVDVLSTNNAQCDIKMYEYNIMCIDRRACKRPCVYLTRVCVYIHTYVYGYTAMVYKGRTGAKRFCT